MVAKAKYLFLYISLVLMLNTRRSFQKIKPGRRNGKPKGPTEAWFTQYLDHYNPNNTQKWKQRYFTNDEYYKPGGPVFLMVKGESEAVIAWMTNGAWIDYAKRFGALCFMLEHRFYGKSRPTEDISTNNLQYLTIEQALSDLALFVAAMNTKFSLDTNIKWIAFGGSYPGALAAWLRLKYPHLIHGGVSSSGVVYSKVDYGYYHQIIAEVLKTHNVECEKAVREGTLKIDTLVKDKEKLQMLNEKFNLCDPIEDSVNNKYDIANFFLRLAGNFVFIQLYKVDFSFENGDIGTANITLDMVCDVMTDKQKGSFVDRLADINTLMLHAYKQPCLDYRYDKLINAGRNISWGIIAPTLNFDRTYWYQLCTQTALFETSSFELGTFGDKFPVEFYFETCMLLFGSEFNSTSISSGVQRKNTAYGGLNFTATNTVFVSGSLDPWYPVGITKNGTSGHWAIFIEGTAHAADMAPTSKEDLPQLKAARKQIIDYISQWLQQ